MAHFYGTIEGNRGTASRLGTKNSGLKTIAASWSGAIRTLLWYDEKTETDMVEIELFPWHGSGTQRTLYRGPVSGRKGLIPTETTNCKPNPYCQCAECSKKRAANALAEVRS